MSSIRQRLLVGLLGGLLLCGLAAGVASFVEAWDEVNGLFDHQLRQVALMVRHERAFTAPPRALEEDDVELVVQIHEANGALVFSSRRGVHLPRSPHAGFATVHARHGHWRVYTMHKGGHTIVVGQPLKERRELIWGMALGNLLPVLGLLPVLAVLIWVVVGRGLRPLDRIATALGHRNPGSLEALPEGGLPVEVRPLVRALNDLLDRLGRALEAQRRFVSDAAHELRTPLTAVHLQAQLLERAESAGERAELLVQLRGGLARATHLVQQLLTMARLEPEEAERPFAPVALREVAEAVLREFAGVAVSRHIDLGLAHEAAARVQGDSESLRILLGNLVDNALRYTPAGGRVDVSLYDQGDAVRLEVQDDGPGIPPAERERVFDRFYRPVPSDAPGSGLGLAIVKAIAERHGARITLGEGPAGRGLRVTVRFAPAPAARAAT